MGASATFRPLLSSRSLDAAVLWEKFPREMFYSKPNVLVSEFTPRLLEQYEAKMVPPGLGMPEEVEMNGPSQQQQSGLGSLRERIEPARLRRKRLCEIIKSATEKRVAAAGAEDINTVPENASHSATMSTAFANMSILAPKAVAPAPAFTLALPATTPSPPSVTGQSGLARLSEGLDNAQFETYLNNIQTLGKSDEYQSHQAWTQVMESAERDVQRRNGEEKMEKEKSEESLEADIMLTNETVVFQNAETLSNANDVAERDDIADTLGATATVPVRAQTWPTMNSSDNRPKTGNAPNHDPTETFAAYIPPHKRPGYQREPSSSPPKESLEKQRRRRGGRGGRRRKGSSDADTK